MYKFVMFIIILRDKFLNLIHNSNVPKAGHFAAFEQPELFAINLRTAFCKTENCAHDLKRQRDISNLNLEICVTYSQSWLL